MLNKVQIPKHIYAVLLYKELLCMYKNYYKCNKLTEIYYLKIFTMTFFLPKKTR